jgi:hypothetical protein
MLGLFSTGCSWELFPFIRNFTDQIIYIKIVSLKDDPETFKNIVAFSRDSLYSINHETSITATDTLRFQKIDSVTAIIGIRPKSTSVVHLPYGWRSDQYIITAEYTK